MIQRILVEMFLGFPKCGEIEKFQALIVSWMCWKFRVWLLRW